MDTIVDELLGTEDNKTKSNNYNNKWAEQEKKRNEAYQIINEMSFTILKGGNIFRQYLNILSNFEKYSVGNCMLILEKNPYAMKIKEKQEWIDKGYELVENAKSITILEPVNVNGKIYYNPKEEYDINQTNATMPTEIEYTEREILLALFNDCEATREVVDVLPNGNKGAEYVKSENKLYMCKGLNSDYLLKTVIQEISKMEMSNINEGEMKDFKTFCVTYMLCKKYGIETSQFDFSKLPSELLNIENSKEIRTELDDIRTNFIKINSKIASYFEQQEKTDKNKEQER